MEESPEEELYGPQVSLAEVASSPQTLDPDVCDFCAIFDKEPRRHR
jgi:hypothetical protein